MKQSIPIKNSETITSVSTGKVTGSNWDATAGHDRKLQIEEARKQAMAEYEARTSIDRRLEMIELKLEALEREVLREKP